MTQLYSCRGRDTTILEPMYRYSSLRRDYTLIIQHYSIALNYFYRTIMLGPVP